MLTLSGHVVAGIMPSLDRVICIRDSWCLLCSGKFALQPVNGFHIFIHCGITMIDSSSNSKIFDTFSDASCANLIFIFPCIRVQKKICPTLLLLKCDSFVFALHTAVIATDQCCFLTIGYRELYEQCDSISLTCKLIFFTLLINASSVRCK